MNEPRPAERKYCYESLLVYVDFNSRIFTKILVTVGDPHENDEEDMEAIQKIVDWIKKMPNTYVR